MQPLRRYEIRPNRPAETPPLPQPSVADSRAILTEPAEKSPAAHETAAAGTARQATTAGEVGQGCDQRPPSLRPPSLHPAPKAKQPVTIKTGWIVQLGSFSNRSNAQGLADRVQKKGFAAYLTPVKRSGKTLYRVRVGPSQPTRDKAAKLADDLRRAGYSGQVTEQVAGG